METRIGLIGILVYSPTFFFIFLIILLLEVVMEILFSPKLEGKSLMLIMFSLSDHLIQEKSNKQFFPCYMINLMGSTE